MATLSIAFAVLALTAHALGNPHPKSAIPTPEGPKPLYRARIHFDGHCPDPVTVEVLVNSLGGSEELKFQTGDPVSKPYSFIGGYGDLKKVQVEADESVEYSIYCTSTLIDRQHILLAGHCVKAPEPNATHIFVYGYSDLTVDASNYATKSKNFAELSDVKQNPNYSNNATNVLNDVSVGTLKTPLTRRQARPICLGSTDRYNRNLIGAGWGMKTCTENSLDSLRKAKATLVSNDDCRTQHWTNLADQQICSLFKTDSGDDAALAPGDSGGPLFGYSWLWRPVQLGVASFVQMNPNNTKDEFCVEKNVPQVYARVTSFKDFINGIATEARWC